MSDSERYLTFFDHFKELRGRLIKCVIAVIITTSVSFIFYDWLFQILVFPVKNTQFVFTEMTEMVGTVMRVCITGGLILAMPYLTLQVLLFISPALSRNEKKYVIIILPWIALMFAGGVVFGYFVLIPPVMKFLLQFGSDIATPMMKIGNYISVVTRLLVAVGIVFEMPVVVTFLARLGIVSSKWLSRKWNVAVIFAFIFAAIITPTYDPINQSLVAVPLIILYVISILLAKLVEPKKTAVKTQ